MRRMTFITIGLALALLAPVARSAAADGAAQATQCCFANPRYSGVCEVSPGEDETCASILAYLNNQSSVGKTYCGNTTVRGGWAQVQCEGDSSSTSCAAPTLVSPDLPQPDSSATARR